MKKMILSLTNTVMPLQSKTNLYHSFLIEDEWGTLTLRFSYFPKVHANQVDALKLVEEAMAVYAPPPYEKEYGDAVDYLPIVNLLTLSLDDPFHYRGCAHRHDPEQTHVLSALTASPGFYSGVLPKGQWQVCISLHCVVTSRCTYALEIFAEEDVCL